MEDIDIPSNEAPEVEEKLDRRAALAEAFDKHASESNDEEKPARAAKPKKPVDPHIAEEVEDTPAKPAKVKDEGVDSIERDAKQDDAEEEQQQTVKAPTSWKAAAREHFNSLPEEVKAEVLRREKEMSTTLSQTAEERKSAKALNDILAPHTEDMKRFGVQPLAVVDDFLKLAKTLREGHPAAKANLIAQIIRQHRIDLPTLNNVLSGKAPTPSTAPGPDPELQRRLEQLESAHKAQTEQSLHKIISDFQNDKKNEFFNDVRADMQKLLATGQAETLPEAYEKAIWLNPDTRAVLLKRQGATKEKLAAAGSVKGSAPKGAAKAGAPKYKTRADALKAAFEQHTGGDRV